MSPELRRTGRTTRQMQAAPLNAIYLWTDLGSLDYPRKLAQGLGRCDLRIVPSCDALHEHGLWLRNTVASAILVDHAVRLTEEEWEDIQLARAVQKMENAIATQDAPR